MVKSLSNSKPTIGENVYGWLCAACILVAYSLNALSYVNATSLMYILLNIFGGIGVAYISIRYRNFQSALINVIWVIIAVVAIIKSFL